MNILPKNVSGFSETEYWNSFFKSTRGKETFEWYGEYEQLGSLLHKYMRPKHNVLIVGCGSSNLSADLHRNGIENQISIDISEVIIKQMKSKYPWIEFSAEDVTQMSYETSRFDAVLDKGTFDALAQATSGERSNDHHGQVEYEDKETFDKAYEMLEEIDRVLKFNGRFICISLLQPFVANKLFSYFISRGWMTRVHRCHEAESRNKENSASSEGGGCFLPVYLVVFSKFKKSVETLEPPIELAVGHEKAYTKLASKDELLKAIADEQTFACILHSLSVLGGTCGTDGFTFKTVTPEGVTRFTLHVADYMKNKNNHVEKKFGVFVIPQGKESEYLFSNHAGRLEVVKQSGYSRLLFVVLERDQIYGSLDTIKAELQEGFRMFAPEVVLDKGIQTTILSIGEDVGERKVIARGISKFVGEYVVEDVTSLSAQTKKKIYLRRLIFLNNPNGIQSEVQLIQGKNKTESTNMKSGRRKSRKKGSPEASKNMEFKQSTSLSCEHHGIQCISLGMLKYFFNLEDNLSTLILGLGGGLMAKFILDFWPKVNLTAVEIDNEIARIALDYFSLPVSDRFHVVIDDALNFIQKTDIQFNNILIDISNESASYGLQCPPPVFVEEEILQCYKTKLTAEGILSVNICCRNDTLKKELICRISKVFPFIYQYKCIQDINEVIFCFKKIPRGNHKAFPGLLKKSVAFMTEVSKRDPTIETSPVNMDEEPSLVAIMDSFKLLKCT